MKVETFSDCAQVGLYAYLKKLFFTLRQGMWNHWWKR